MSYTSSTHQPLPSAGRLIKATLVAAAIAAVLLVTTVMPAEYGIDPTGIGARLGLMTLADIDADVDVGDEPTQLPAAADVSVDMQARNLAEAAKASQVFGSNDKQTFATQALAPVAAGKSPRSEAMTVILEPGKGIEVKMLLGLGEGVVYQWTADGDVAIDMHGERPADKGPWTSYSIEAGQRSASGTFTAPFEGTHGWYWLNRGESPVTVKVDVTGFQEALYQP